MKVKPLRVLVTGGSGFVGKAVVQSLLRRGHEIIATTHVQPVASLPAAQRLRWVGWDAAAEPLPRLEGQTLDVLLHLAVPRKPFLFPQDATAMYKVAIEAVFRLADWAQKSNVSRVLIASTGDVLGPHEISASEHDAGYAPASFYGAAKACSELILRAYGNIFQAAVLRFFHPYGPGGDRFLVNRMIKAVLEDQEIRCGRPEGILLNPVWVDDLADGVAAAVESSAAGVFHFAGADTVRFKTLLEIIGNALGKQPHIRWDTAADAGQHAGDCAHAHAILAWRPAVSLKEGIQRVAARMTQAAPAA